VIVGISPPRTPAAEAAVRGGAEPFNILAEQLGQLWMDRHYAAVAVWAVLA
jgi:hypothetical protein